MDTLINPSHTGDRSSVFARHAAILDSSGIIYLATLPYGPQQDTSFLRRLRGRTFAAETHGGRPRTVASLILHLAASAAQTSMMKA